MSKKIQKIILCIPLALIKGYQTLISPVCGGCCRFQPSCSEYAKQAFLLHGVLKGARLTFFRLLKCHPWGQSGYDPVPPVNQK